MPDVLKLANERRAALLKEVSAMDRFIEMANALLASVPAQQPVTANKPTPSSSLQPTPLPSSVNQRGGASSETEAFLRTREKRTQQNASTAAAGTSKAATSALG